MTDSIYSTEELGVIEMLEHLSNKLLRDWRLSKKNRPELLDALGVVEKLVIYHALQTKYPEQFYGTYDQPEYSVADRYMTHAGAK